MAERALFNPSSWSTSSEWRWTREHWCSCSHSHSNSHFDPSAFFSPLIWRSYFAHNLIATITHFRRWFVCFYFVRYNNYYLSVLVCILWAGQLLSVTLSSPYPRIPKLIATLSYTIFQALSYRVLLFSFAHSNGKNLWTETFRAVKCFWACYFKRPTAESKQIREMLGNETSFSLDDGHVKANLNSNRT